MKKRKLKLSSETLKVLSESQARRVVGGETEDTDCRPCMETQTGCGGCTSPQQTCWGCITVECTDYVMTQCCSYNPPNCTWGCTVPDTCDTRSRSDGDLFELRPLTRFNPPGGRRHLCHAHAGMTGIHPAGILFDPLGLGPGRGNHCRRTDQDRHDTFCARSIDQSVN